MLKWLGKNSKLVFLEVPYLSISVGLIYIFAIFFSNLAVLCSITLHSKQCTQVTKFFHFCGFLVKIADFVLSLLKLGSNFAFLIEI